MLDALMSGDFARLWMNYFLTIPGCALAIVFGIIVLAKTNKNPGNYILKGIAVTAVMATLPLTLRQVGLNIAISDMYAVTYASIIGTIVALITGFPYLFVNKNSIVAVANSDVSVDNQKDNDLFNETITKKIGKLGSLNNLKEAVSETPDRTLNTIQPLDLSTITMPGSIQKSVDRANNTVTSIGRSDTNDIVIDDSKVSREHAQVKSTETGFVIEDNNSTNGITVDGLKVTSSPITAKSEIKIGNTRYTGESLISQTKVMSEMPQKDNNSTPVVKVNQKQVEPNDDSQDEVKQDSSSEELNTGTVKKEQSKPETVSWLTIKEGPNQGQSFQFTGNVCKIGRASDNHLALQDSTVSRNHAIIKNKNGKLIMFDNGSASGTLVNQDSIPGLALKTSDILTVGETELTLVKIQGESDNVMPKTTDNTLRVDSSNADAILMVTKGPNAGKSFTLSEGRNTVGRSKDNIIELSDPTISRDHCVIVKEKDEYQVYELGSESGTKINSQIVEGKLLGSGDLVSMGKTKIEYTSIGFGS